MDKLIAGTAELGITLTPHQLQQFQTYYQELMSWNQRINLTSITGYEAVQLKHFVDSLSVAPAVAPCVNKNGLCHMLDVGSGAGLPGLPLKIIFPQINLVLLESIAKKTVFLQHIVDVLHLKDVEVIAQRAEDLAHDDAYREKFDVVVSRAVAPLPALLELTLPFARVGGIAVAQKKGEIADEMQAASRAIDLLGGKLREAKKVVVNSLSDERYLVIIDKVATTPPLYPRRAGVPTHRPIL